MPTISEIVANLQKIQEIRRQQNKKRIEKRWLQATNTVPQSNYEEENLNKNIEEFPIKQNEIQVSWLNKPRVFNNGWFTNLNVKEPVKIQNDGGEIN